MIFSDAAIQTLADRMSCGGASPQRFHEALEASLAPLIRCALRDGAGLPQLVRWVRTALPRVTAAADRGRPVDPDRAAPPLARMLCAALLRGRPAAGPAAAGARETVVGR
jgi:hypothetical protein